MDSGSEVCSGAWDPGFTALAFSKAVTLFSLLEPLHEKQVIISWTPWLTPTIPAPMKLRQWIARVWGHIVSTRPASAVNSKTLSQTITTNKQSYNNKTLMFDSVGSERVRWYLFSGNQGRELWGYLGSGGSKPRKMGVKEWCLSKGKVLSLSSAGGGVGGEFGDGGGIEPKRICKENCI